MRVGHRLVVWGAWLVGVVLLFAAVQKSLDVLMIGVRLKGSPAHLKLLEYAQVAAIVPEMLLGAALLAGRPGKSAIVAATCLFMAFTLVAGVIAVYGHSDVLCACLGRRIHLPVYWHLTLNGAILSTLGACLVWSERQSTEQPAGVQSSIRSGNAATWAWRIAIVLVVAVAVWVLLHRRSAHDHGERRVPEAARSSGWRARPLPPSGDDTSASEHALAASQGVAVSEPVPEQAPQTLSISTVAASGGPIGHARVDCVGAGRSRERIAVADLHATGHSNEHGVLALSCPGPAAEILARHPSFLPAAHKVTADEWARGAVTVVMHEGESIRGRVLTTSGSPVAGLTVRALGPRSGGMWRDSEGAIFGG